MTTVLSGPMMPAKSGAAPKQLMVLLHGYGADGNDLISLGYQWWDMFPDMMFVSPDAPTPCGAIGAGFQWFAVDYERRAEMWKNGPPSVAPVLVKFLIDLWAQTGLGPRDTVLAGFSQGAMMALHVGTSLDQELAGIMGFSGAFSPPPGFGSGRFAKPSVALIHGDSDEIVATHFSREAAAALTAEGFDVKLHICPGVAHGISPDGLDFATAFLAERLGVNA